MTIEEAKEFLKNKKQIDEKFKISPSIAGSIAGKTIVNLEYAVGLKFDDFVRKQIIKRVMNSLKDVEIVGGKLTIEKVAQEKERGIQRYKKRNIGF